MTKEDKTRRQEPAHNACGARIAKTATTETKPNVDSTGHEMARLKANKNRVYR
ncbi:MAG: hypothetical protein GY804_10885 [Alphaproteobacteria bacterium]|nr:hypothetical protein [Alphaproteobacteria bacterium]